LYKYKIILINFILLIECLNASDISLETANKYYYAQLSNIAIIKDRSLSSYQRELAFQNLIIDVDGSAWVTLNEGFIEILSVDSTFLFEEFYKHSDIYKSWLINFNFNWFKYDKKSIYPELKSLSMKALKEDIRKTEKILKMKEELLRKIEATSPTVID